MLLFVSTFSRLLLSRCCKWKEVTSKGPYFYDITQKIRNLDPLSPRVTQKDNRPIVLKQKNHANHQPPLPHTLRDVIKV